jgi:glycosyltransferase involved in cell wall biosynthesis
MINSTELISIIMPAKNASAWIEDCIDSIIQQSYSSWELIAVNDHSADDTATIIEGFSEKDIRIKFYQNTGEGIIDALNTALSHAYGHWITRMDADDIMPNHKLESLASTLKWNPMAVATGKVKYFSEKPISKGYTEYEAWLNERIDHNDHWDWIYRECVVSSANWLTHRNNIQFEAGVYPEDYALTFHWFNNGLHILGTNKTTHLWREHLERTSRNSDDYQQASFFKLKIGQFLQRTKDHNRPLVVMGHNQKSRMTIEILEEQKSDFQHIHADNLQLLERIDSPQVLIAVFPKAEEKQSIEELMASHDLTMGKDWWWL